MTKFLRFFLFLMTLTVLKITGEIFCRMSLKWGLSEVFLLIRLDNVLGGGPQRHSISLIIPHQGAHHQHDSPLWILSLITLVEVFVSFLHYQVILLCLPFHPILTSLLLHFKINEITETGLKTCHCCSVTKSCIKT